MMNIGFSLMFVNGNEGKHPNIKSNRIIDEFNFWKRGLHSSRNSRWLNTVLPSSLNHHSKLDIIGWYRSLWKRHPQALATCKKLNLKILKFMEDLIFCIFINSKLVFLGQDDQIPKNSLFN